MEEKKIKQVILDKDGNEKEFPYNIEDLKITKDENKANKDRKEIYERMRKDKPLFLNEDLKLSSNAISKHYEYVKEFCELVGIKYDEKQERTSEEWNELKEWKKYKNIKVSNLGRVIINENLIIIQKEKTEKKENSKGSQGYLVLDKEKYKDKNIYLPSMNMYNLEVEAWIAPHPKDGCSWAVHHITNAGYDNRPENLIRLKWCDHVKVHPTHHSFMLNTPPIVCKNCPIYQELKNDDK